LFAKSEFRIQTIKHLYGNLRFCENELKVSDIAGKRVLSP